MIRLPLHFAVGAGLLTWALAVAGTPPSAPVAPAPATAAPADDVQDLLYLGEKRPYRIRLHLRIKGESLQQRWEGFMARLFKYADVNGDNMLSKPEVTRLPTAAALKNQVEGSFLGTNSLIPFDELDGDKDGKVTLRELMAYFSKSGCGPVHALSGQNRGAATAQLTDAIFKQLDPKGGGKISEQALRGAKDTLFALDINEDELISTEELAPGSRFGFGRPEKKEKEIPRLALVNRHDPPAKQVAPLLARYGKDKKDKLSRAEIGLDAAAFTTFDANKDGVLDVNELAQWRAQSADLELLVPLQEPRIPLDLLDQPRFAPETEKDRPIELLNASACALPLAASLSGKGRRSLTVSSASSFIEFHQERSSQWSIGRRRYEFLQKFRAAQNSDGLVTKKAAMRNRELRGLFTCMDRNGDGKMTEEEFGAFFDLLADVNRCFTVVMVSDLGPCLFDLLDTNRDRHLGARELRNAWKNVAAWDANKDGAISKQEVPHLLQVTLCCGRPDRLNFFDDVEGNPEAADKERPTEPLWYRKMDVNGDGDISRSEWLGSDEDFRRIDTDGDGLIDAQEATRADAWFRAKLGGGSVR